MVTQRKQQKFITGEIIYLGSTFYWMCMQEKMTETNGLRLEFFAPMYVHAVIKKNISYISNISSYTVGVCSHLTDVMYNWG